MEYVIESNIPLAHYSTGTMRALRALEPGQSFLIPLRKNLNGIHSYFKPLRPSRFTARVLPEGVRIWRIK